MTGLGLLAIWDGCRDVLAPRKKLAKPSQLRQAILTGADGRRRSDVSRKALREQLALLAERGASFSLEILPKPEVPDLGWIERVICTYEGIFSVLACFVTGEGVCIALEKSEIAAAQAEEILAGILDGTMDFSGWESEKWPPPEREEPPQGLLVLWGDGWYECLPFFAERDPELTVEGLVQEKYTRAELYLDGRRFLVFAEHREEVSGPPEAVLQMVHHLGNRSLVYEKKGCVSQVQEWLVELFQSGWGSFGWLGKTP